ncbi:MAG: hypothetical protein ACR2P9_05970 [Gammaproteobacteria bacterium]
MTTRYLLLIALLSGANTALAADKTGNYAIWGKGGKSCYSYNKSRETAEDQAYKDYIMGYITAYNLFTDKTYSITAGMNMHEILGWFDDYCGDKPIHGFEQALTGFIAAHHKTRYIRPPGSRLR